MSLQLFVRIASVCVFALPMLGALLLDRPRNTSIDVVKETNGDLSTDEVEFFLVDSDPYQ